MVYSYETIFPNWHDVKINVKGIKTRVICLCFITLFNNNYWVFKRKRTETQYKSNLIKLDMIASWLFLTKYIFFAFITFFFLLRH